MLSSRVEKSVNVNKEQLGSESQHRGISRQPITNRKPQAWDAEWKRSHAAVDSVVIVIESAFPSLSTENSLSPLRRSTGYIAGYHRDGGDIAAGDVVVVLRRWLLEEEPREHHHVAFSIWTYKSTLTVSGNANQDEERRRCCRVVAPITERFEDERVRSDTPRIKRISYLLVCGD